MSSVLWRTGETNSSPRTPGVRPVGWKPDRGQKGRCAPWAAAGRWSHFGLPRGPISCCRCHQPLRRTLSTGGNPPLWPMARHRGYAAPPPPDRGSPPTAAAARRTSDRPAPRLRTPAAATQPKAGDTAHHFACRHHAERTDAADAAVRYAGAANRRRRPPRPRRGRQTPPIRFRHPPCACSPQAPGRRGCPTAPLLPLRNAPRL